MAQSETYDPRASKAEDAPTRAGPQPPNRLGDKIMGEHAFVSDRGGTVYRYNARCWDEATQHYLQALALAADGKWHSKANRRTEVASYIRARGFISWDQSPTGEIPWGRVADHEVACYNGVLDALTGRMRDHAPEDYLERTLPWHYKAGAYSEAWMKALDVWFEDDIERRAALQEFFGYCILSHAKYKKALLLYGPTNAGKSLVLQVLRLLIGAKQTCQLSVEDMDDPVKRETLIGKGLNLMSELPADAMIKDGGFKQLVSTEEPILINPKYKPAHDYTPSAKHVISTNNLPRINDKTEATFGRLLMIVMDRVLSDDERDVTLAAQIGAQMEGVLAWAVEGAKRLIARGGIFNEPGSSASVMAEYREAENPAKQFLREQTEVDVTNAIPLSALTDAFNKWLGARKMSTRQVGELMRKAGQVVKPVRLGKTTHRCLIGFKLLDIDLGDSLTVPELALISGSGEVEGSKGGVSPGAATAGEGVAADGPPIEGPEAPPPPASPEDYGR